MRIAQMVLAAAVLSTLIACTPEQLLRAQTYQDKIASVCATASALTPFAGPYAVWIIGGCSTEAKIAKLALDPSSLAWLNDLILKARGIS